MSGVAIITDSISCIPPELVDRYNIKILPAGLVIDRKAYADMSLTNEQFWEMFRQAREPVTTVAITPQEFENAFLEVGKTAAEMVCILFSQVLSATFSAAGMGREAAAKQNPRLKIEIIDSRSAAGAEGFIVLEAAQAAKNGKALAEVAQAARDAMPRANFFCTLDTLKYLIRCGRAPKIAMLGDLMKVKPIISINKESGMVENFGRARGKKKAIAEMVKMVQQNVGNKPVRLNIHYSDNAADAEEIKKVALANLNVSEVMVTPYSPVMASQCGPVVAISFIA